MSTRSPAGLKALLTAAPAWTLAVAESLTCGHLQARIGAIAGASNFLLGGITAYSLEQKVRHLGVDRARAAAVNCVSAAVAEEMARGAAALFGANVGVATTGYAEPAPAQGITAPFAWWAVALRDSARAEWRQCHGRIECPGASRVDAQTMVADAAFGELTAFLRECRAA